MTVRSASILAMIAALTAMTAVAQAAVIYNESINGDLSNNPLAPTALALSVGDNFLSATSGGADREYVRLTVPVASQLSQVILTSYSSLFDDVAFIGVQAGPVVTVDPDFPSATPLLGYAHFGPSKHPEIPFDYLPDIAVGFGAIGFTGPLPSGIYTFWIQQLSASSPSTYQFDFVTVSTVPEPSTAAATLLLAAVCLGVSHRSRRRILR